MSESTMPIKYTEMSTCRENGKATDAVVLRVYQHTVCLHIYRRRIKQIDIVMCEWVLMVTNAPRILALISAMPFVLV